jgi:ankyrin repeat protein
MNIRSLYVVDFDHLIAKEALMTTAPGPTQEIIDEFVGVAHGDYARVEELLNLYPTLVDARATWGETPLEAASQTGQRKIAELLLRRGAPLDICTAAMLGMTDQVASMLQADSNQAHAMGAHEIPVMYYPALYGHTQIAELLLSHGANINAGTGKETALHGATSFGQLAMAEWLIEHGADINPSDFNGKTPLRVAVESDHKDVGYLLWQHGGTE